MFPCAEELGVTSLDEAPPARDAASVVSPDLSLERRAGWAAIAAGADGSRRRSPLWRSYPGWRSHRRADAEPRGDTRSREHDQHQHRATPAALQIRGASPIYTSRSAGPAV
jgi:hypothetical protein